MLLTRMNCLVNVVICKISGSDGFHVTAQPTGFGPQQSQNQPPNQGGAIRGMAPTGPPTQASTPPQSEQMKQMQQQQQPNQPMPMAYVQQTVRTGQSYTHYRTPPPNPGGQRMPNHHRQVAATNQMFAPHVSIYPGPMTQPMATYQLPMQYHSNAQRGPFYSAQPFTTMLPGQYIQSTYPAHQPQTPQQYYSAQYPQPMAMASRGGGPGGAVAAAPQGAPQPQQPPVMQPPLAQQQQPKKRIRDKAIPIINPDTGKNINDEDESLPTSGDNSARETPQPNNLQVIINLYFARIRKLYVRRKYTKEQLIFLMNIYECFNCPLKLEV